MKAPKTKRKAAQSGERQPRVVSLLPASADEWERQERVISCLKGMKSFTFWPHRLDRRRRVGCFRYLVALRSNHQRETASWEIMVGQEDAADKGRWCLPREAEPQRTKISTGDGLTYSENEMVTREKSSAKISGNLDSSSVFLQQCALP